MFSFANFFVDFFRVLRYTIFRFQKTSLLEGNDEHIV